ncbi:NADPH:adrenodoxin oxidoreductase-like protein [Immersiella caudata]|uniref:NADPH:adrenodoxin oxidoreductase, mitochondrial n=1 Tax=Immersiella caudata TaxID=314043 RepID=A0AA39X6K5_9PEZI|nr:NADPH:adrenodoxin oxidoreductase-like protein [Immersiella caudata]
MLALAWQRTNNTPPRIAIIGSGPAGFYTAHRTLTRLPTSHIDMYEALPVPFGLVRFGVAPDHPEVKNCQDTFTKVASHPNFTFLGNVSVGNPSDHDHGVGVSLGSVMRNYHAVVFAYGASRDRKLGVRGEGLKGVYSAREFVGWYNGLPACAGLEPELGRGEEAVVVGQGNVALDVARILLSDVDVLAKLDVPEHALARLAESKVRRVHVVGRRGPLQAAFSTKEARELMRLEGLAFHPLDKGLFPEDLKTLPRASRRLSEILLKGSPTPVSTTPGGKSWSLDFLLSPSAFLSSPDSPDHLSSTTFTRNTLTSPFSPTSSVEPLNPPETITIPSSIAFRSIGYKAAPLQDFQTVGIPFDEGRGVVKHDPAGRVQHTPQDGGKVFQGLYCTGWVKTGPTGVIASTMGDAFATGDAIVEDAERLSNEGRIKGGWEGVLAEENVARERVVSWEDWNRIDGAEKERGRELGKEREKMVQTEEMLEVLR